MEGKFLRSTCLVVGLIALYGCGKREASNNKAAGRENVLKFPITTNIQTLDPSRCVDQPSHQLIKQIFEGLVYIDGKNNPQPALASSWEISKDKKTYTFHLKKNVKFHNGKLFTAEDVKWTFERACDPIKGSPQAKTYLNDIVGVHQKLLAHAPTIAGINVINSHEITITLEKPKAFFLKNLSLPISYILPKDSTSETEIIIPQRAIGTGPFKMDQYHPGQLVTLKANKDYHQGKPSIDGIRISIVKDATMAIDQYKSGRFDICKVPQIKIEELRKDPVFKDQLHIYNFASVYYLELNPGAYKPFQDVRVRKAFGMAIDRAYYSRNMLSHIAKKATSLIPRGVPGHREQVKDIPFEPERARVLLKEAGYATGAKLPPLDIYLCADAPTAKKVAENVALQLRQNLEVPVSVKLLEQGAYCRKVHQKQVPLRFAGWVMNCIDPADFLSDLFTTRSQMNFCNYSSPQFDELCDKADCEFDKAKRLSYYAQAEDVLLQDGIVYPLYYPIDPYLIRKEVKNYQTNLAGFAAFGSVKIEDTRGSKKRLAKK